MLTLGEIQEKLRVDTINCLNLIDCLVGLKIKINKIEKINNKMRVKESNDHYEEEKNQLARKCLTEIDALNTKMKVIEKKFLRSIENNRSDSY